MRLAVYIALSEKIQTAFTDRWLRPVRLTGREGEGTAGASTRMQTGDSPRGNTSIWRTDRSPLVLIYPTVINNTVQDERKRRSCVPCAP